MTKDRVSAICRGLDERVDAFRNRPLEGNYTYLWLDANHVKVRDQGRVVSKAIVVDYAVHESGVREVLGLDVGEVEPGSFWVEFLRGLKRRGLAVVKLCITDQHEGLKQAAASATRWVATFAPSKWTRTAPSTSPRRSSVRDRELDHRPNLR